MVNSPKVYSDYLNVNESVEEVEVIAEIKDVLRLHMFDTLTNAQEDPNAYDMEITISTERSDKLRIDIKATERV